MAMTEAPAPAADKTKLAPARTIATGTCRNRPNMPPLRPAPLRALLLAGATGLAGAGGAAWVLLLAVVCSAPYTLHVEHPYKAFQRSATGGRLDQCVRGPTGTLEKACFDSCRIQSFLAESEQ